MVRTLMTAVGLVGALTAGASAQDFDREKDRVFVTGVGKVEVSPDIAVVTLGAESRHPDWTTANDRSRVVADAVRKAIRDAGIPEEDVRTDSISVSPVVDYSDGAPKIVAYQSAISVQVKVREMGKTGPLIDAAVAAGATNVYGPSFEISDPEKFEKEARALAMVDARDRADTLAEAGGFSINGVISVAESTQGNFNPQPMMARGMMAEMSEAPPTEVSSGTREIVVNISAIFSLWDEPDM